MVTKAQRKQYNGDVKARAVIEAIKGVRTVNEIAAAYGVHFRIGRCPLPEIRWPSSLHLIFKVIGL